MLCAAYRHLFLGVHRFALQSAASSKQQQKQQQAAAAAAAAAAQYFPLHLLEILLYHDTCALSPFAPQDSALLLIFHFIPPPLLPPPPLPNDFQLSLFRAPLGPCSRRRAPQSLSPAPFIMSHTITLARPLSSALLTALQAPLQSHLT